MSIAAVADILALSARTNVLLWDLQTQRRVGQFDIQADRSIALSADARLLATGSKDQKVRLYDCQTGKELSPPLLGHLSGVERVAFAPDGRTMATSSTDGSVKLWDPVTGQERAVLEGHHGLVRTLAFAPDGHVLATGDSEGLVKLWFGAPKSVDSP